MSANRLITRLARRALCTRPPPNPPPTLQPPSSRSLAESVPNGTLLAVDHAAASTDDAHSKAETISHAMKMYMRRAKEYEFMLADEIDEFELGKKHLAHIVGADPNNFSTEQIDEAIRYLLPSGLSEPKARPILQHPVKLHPPRKAAAFDASGRPLHFLFYTAYQNFYHMMHNAVQALERLKRAEDANPGFRIRKKDKLNLVASEWMSKDDLAKKLIEKIDDDMYNSFVHLFTRLAEHPLAGEEHDFIMEHRSSALDTTGSGGGILNKLPIDQDSHGNLYVDARGTRKNAEAAVRLWVRGTGRVTINDEPITYFRLLFDRHQLMFPLLVSEKLNEVDIEARVWNGGHSGQAGAIRFAVSHALCSIVNQPIIDRMRVAGLLTPDPRVHERKYFGQKGARKKFTWKRR